MQKNTNTIIKPTIGINSNNTNQPLLSVSCNLLTVTPSEGKATPKLYKTKSPSFIELNIRLIITVIRMHSTLNYKSPENYEKERKQSKLCV